MSDSKNKNVFDLGQYRNQPRRPVKRAGASAGKNDKKPKKNSSSSFRWFHYLQFVLFLAVLAYFARSCGF